MTAGQCCVLLANQDAVKKTPIARCLFGTPDPEETRKLEEEVLAANRERMLRWGVDILALDSLKNTSTVAVIRPTPYSRQPRISDFWRSKRASSSMKSSSDKKVTDQSPNSDSNSNSSSDLQQP